MNLAPESRHSTRVADASALPAPLHGPRRGRLSQQPQRDLPAEALSEEAAGQGLPQTSGSDPGVPWGSAWKAASPGPACARAEGLGNPLALRSITSSCSKTPRQHRPSPQPGRTEASDALRRRAPNCGTQSCFHRNQFGGIFIFNYSTTSNFPSTPLPDRRREIAYVNHPGELLTSPRSPRSPLKRRGCCKAPRMCPGLSETSGDGGGLCSGPWDAAWHLLCPSRRETDHLCATE